MNTAQKIIIPAVALLLGAGAIGYQAFAQTNTPQPQSPAAVTASTQAEVQVSDPVDTPDQAGSTEVETTDDIGASVHADASQGSGTQDPADTAPDQGASADTSNAD